MLSSLYVHTLDPGATVVVTYHQATTGQEVGEEVLLATHNIVSVAGTTDQITVPRIHNKPTVTVTVTGGNVTLGLLVTVVDTIVSDIDQALAQDGESFELLQDKAMPTAGLDESSNVLRFLRLDSQGRLLISGDVQVVSQRVNNVQSGIELNATSDTPYLLIDYTVPVGKTFVWLDGLGHASTIAEYRVEIDTELYIVAGTGCTVNDVKLQAAPAVVLEAGQNIKVTVTPSHPAGSNSRVYAFLYGNLS